MSGRRAGRSERSSSRWQCWPRVRQLATAPPLVLPTNSAPSSIYDAQGRLITTLQHENRTSVTLDQIPTTASRTPSSRSRTSGSGPTTVSTPRPSPAPPTSNVDSGEISEGGSTITQQYVKTALLTPASSR